MLLDCEFLYYGDYMKFGTTKLHGMRIIWKNIRNIQSIAPRTRLGKRNNFLPRFYPLIVISRIGICIKMRNQSTTRSRSLSQWKLSRVRITTSRCKFARTKWPRETRIKVKQFYRQISSRQSSQKSNKRN